MELQKRLNLNKHPGDCVPYSFVAAKNIKISNDERVIVNEEGLEDCDDIANAIHANGTNNFKIVGVIPTSTELVLFVLDIDSNQSSIYRYDNENNVCAKTNTNWDYNGGKIKGTYTYNVDGDLIICIAEYDANIDVPLKTININKDTHIDKKNYIVPEVPYCSIMHFATVAGRAYRGYYEFYVRYKIDDNNYTQWYYINGKPLLDEITDKQIMGIGVLDNSYNSIRGHLDFVSEDTDLCNFTLQCSYVVSDSDIVYDKLQFAYIVTSKAYTKCYRTNDMTFFINAQIGNNYFVNPKNEIEYSIEELTKSYYNYYNVGNIINYKNRVYISNYKENNYNIKEEDLIDESTNGPYSIHNNLYLSTSGSGLNITYNRYFDLIYIVSNDNDQGKVVMSRRTKILMNISDGQFQYCRFSDFIGTTNCKVTIESVEYNASEVYFKFQAPYMMGVYELCVSTIDNVKPKDTVITYKIKNDSQSYELKVGYVFALTWYYIPSIAPNDITKNTLLAGEVYDFYIHFVDKFGHTTNGIKLINDGTNFDIYTNSNNDKLFQIRSYKSLYNNGYRYVQLLMRLTALPKGYVAAFISYAKFNKTRKITGLLDFKGTGVISDLGINDVRLNTGYIDAGDKIDIGINSIYSETIKINRYANSSLIEVNATSNFGEVKKYITSSDVPDDDSMHIYYTHKGADLIKRSILSNGVVVADSSTNNNIGRESYIKIPVESIPDECKYNDESRTLVSLANESSNLYVEDQKELIPTACVCVKIGSAIHNYDNGTGYNGFFAIDTFINYNYKGFILNTTTGAITTLNNDHTYNKDAEALKNDKPYTAYSIIYPFDYPLHYKVINNAPTIQFYVYNNDKNGVEYIVEPKNTVDLYAYRHPLKSDVGSNKLFINYNKNNINKLEYNQTIRRSDVIQDENRTNSWRRFPIEGYKNITENKGNITNLVGIGYYLLVHTEHSMFMFDVGASLKTKDKDVQLYQPDAFEVDYREIFTSDKGYGGLQDDLAYIIGEFGYIFYNNDFHKIYQFDNGQLKLMYDDIQLWLDKYRPINVRFAHDKYNNRILIKFDYYYDNINPNERNIIVNHNEVISYNYNIGKFISLHDYYFNQAWSTKTECYFITEHNNNGINCPLHRFTHEYNFGRYHSSMGRDSRSLYMIHRHTIDDITINNSYVDIIVNESYEIIKFLEFIKYKVRKIFNPIYSNNLNNPVDLRDHPYAGDILRIFNEDNDSDDIDINVDKINQFNKYKKPWYELTQWNFNYFRNNINDHSAPKNIPSDKLRRLYGNYFIIRFVFYNIDNKRIELESLECAQTKFRKL